MELFVSIVGAITAVIGLGTAWLSFQKTRHEINRDRSNRRNNRQSTSSPNSVNNEGFGCQKILSILAFGLIGLIGLNIFTSTAFKPSTPVAGAYCCDLSGMRRCPLVLPLPTGSPCFCPYQGTGFTCY